MSPQTHRKGHSRTGLISIEKVDTHRDTLRHLFGSGRDWPSGRRGVARACSHVARLYCAAAEREKKKKDALTLYKKESLVRSFVLFFLLFLRSI